MTLAHKNIHKLQKHKMTHTGEKAHKCYQCLPCVHQGCISCGPCSCPELTEDHVLPSAYVKFFRIVTRNAVNKSFWRKKDCSWPPLNKYAMNIWLSSLRIRAHLSWRTGKHLHVLHVLRTYSTCSYPGYQDTTTYAALAYTHQVLRYKWGHTWGRCLTNAVSATTLALKLLICTGTCWHTLK